MIMLLDQILDPNTQAIICDVLQDGSLFEDGKKTAGKTARNIKFNLQAKASSPLIARATGQIKQALLANARVKHFAFPLKLDPIMFNRYEADMHYGAHVDNAFISGMRTDLSFTLFLSGPESYKGGELVIQHGGLEQKIKPALGSLVLYPSTAVHYVAPVKSGVRLAAVGWIQSRIRHHEQRVTLFDMYQALQALENNAANQEARLAMLKVQSNLMRQWAD